MDDGRLAGVETAYGERFESGYVILAREERGRLACRFVRQLA